MLARYGLSSPTRIVFSKRQGPRPATSSDVVRSCEYRVMTTPTIRDTRHAVPTDPPHRIHRPVMVQEWRNATFAHWPVDPVHTQALLPRGLHVDTHAGTAWVGLIAFEMAAIRIPGTPRVPYLGTFPETNVRTYVRDASGRPGVWFHSLEASRLLPVATARATYSLPYMWARMSITHSAGHVRYRSERRWPGPRGAGGTITVAPGSVVTEPDPLDVFLTARWGLYSTSRSGTLRYAPVEHPAWPLHRASAGHLRDSLVTAAGYPPPVGEPHVLWSPGVPVRIGLPTVVH